MRRDCLARAQRSQSRLARSLPRALHFTGGDRSLDAGSYGALVTFPSGAPQAFWAAWNAGEFGSIPPLLLSCSWTPPPPNVGSGKPEIPCARMHCENWSICCRRAAESCRGLPPFGSFERHACIADWNAGPLTLTPLTLVPFGDACTSIPPLPFAPGSGKLGTPCVRMHEANCSALAWLAGSAAPVPVPPLEFDADEPQAASGSAAAVRAASTRRELSKGMPQWYETAGYQGETPAVTCV
jgi:hypothetical protein